MATANNLLGLMNQLQNLETMFTGILVEAALKLSALTETNVFVLIETSESRKFAGSTHLCQSYASSQLSPVGNDVELTLENFQPSLKETPLVPPPSASSHRLSLNHRNDSITDAHLLQGFVPSHLLSSNSDNGVVGSKGSSTSPSGSGFSSLVPSSRAGRKRSSPSEPKDTVATTSSPAKSSRTMDALVKMEEEAVVKLDDCGDEDLPSPHSDGGDSDIIFENECFPAQGVDMASFDLPTQFVDDSTPHWIHKFLQDNIKTVPVKTLTDASMADKNSVGSKVLSSFLYDFAKQVAMFSRETGIVSWQEYCSDCFEKLWCQLPNLVLLNDQGLTIQRSKTFGKRKLSLKAFARETVQSVCRNTLKRNNNLS